jgi:UDP-2,3-diacylglucosamine pyrophosphatase LpxH
VRTLVVSDLHLGSPIRLPRADGELCHLLLSEKWEQVVLGGDVFDLWRSSFHAISAVHRTVMAVFASLSCPVVFVPGNHDDVFRGLTRLDSFEVSWPSYTFESAGRKIRVVHGDTYDDSVLGHSKAGALLLSVLDRIATWFAGPGVSIRRSLHHSFVDRGPGREMHAKPLLARAAAGEPDADVLIVGHTHTPSIPAMIGGCLVLNSGDFGPEHMTYVIVEAGHPTLCRV